MKTAGMDNTIADFLSQHTDDPDAIKNAKKRVAYGEYWCKDNEWKFMFGTVEDSDVGDLSIYWQLLTMITGYLG